MKKILLSCFTGLLQKGTKRPSIAEQNKALLRGELKKCYTISDIKNLQQIARLSVREFTIKEFLDFNLDVNYRIHLINICIERHSRNIYSTPTIYGLFKAARSFAECDALILHLEQNADLYRSDLTIFYNMASKRTAAIMTELYAQSA